LNLSGGSGVTGGKQRCLVLESVLGRELSSLTTHPLALGVEEGHVRQPYQA
jgi:hypothetical protein